MYAKQCMYGITDWFHLKTSFFQTLWTPCINSVIMCKLTVITNKVAQGFKLYESHRINSHTNSRSISICDLTPANEAVVNKIHFEVCCEQMCSKVKSCPIPYDGLR